MCNAQTCSSSLYCAPSSSASTTSSIGQCLCDSSSTSGTNCAVKVQYDLTDWTSWNSCSVNCDSGKVKFLVNKGRYRISIQIWLPTFPSWLQRY
jgi:hypothetical protein